MCNLSVEMTRKFTNYKIYLYSDNHFLDHLKFDDVNYIDFFDDNLDKRYWNIPKFKTYSLQEEPFIHIDFDLHVLPHFKIGNTDIICEKIRSIDKSENATRHCHDAQYAICSGIMGTSTNKGLDYFKHLYEHAKEECVIGKWETVNLSDLFSLEECYTYNYAIANNFTVSYPEMWTFQHYAGGNKEERFSFAVKQALKNYRMADR